MTGGLGGRRTNGDHSNYNIIGNGQNTEKSPGDLRRLAVNQTVTVLSMNQIEILRKNKP